MDWFRVYHGMPSDPKWLLVARHAGHDAAPGHVVAVWAALLDHASAAKPRGSVESVDVESIAAGFGWSTELVAGIYAALIARRHIVDGHLRAWSDRNPSKFDSTNAARQKRHRERKKNAAEVEAGASIDNNENNARYAVTRNASRQVTPTEEIERSDISDEASADITDPRLKQTTTRTVRERAPAFENVGAIWTALAAEGMPASFSVKAFSRKQLAGWLAQGLTEPQLAEAVSRARARRKAQNNPRPVNLGYLACFVDEVISGAPSKLTNGGGYERGDELSREFAQG